MENKISPCANIDSESNSNCELFDILPFPKGAFKPPSKEDYVKRIRCEKCRECPFFGWSVSGLPGRDGVDGRPGRDGRDGADGKDGKNGIDGIDGNDGKDGNDGTNGRDGKDGVKGERGEQGATGTFDASSLFVWKTDQQTLAPALMPGDKGDSIGFTDFDNYGTAMSFSSPTDINILETGRYSIKWEVYTSGHDSAFALFFDADGTEAKMVPGSNYGALSHNEKYGGQLLATLTEGGVLTLARIDTLNPLTILDQISDGISAIGASITIIKIA